MAEEEFNEFDDASAGGGGKKGGLPSIVIFVVIALIMGVGGFFAGKMFFGSGEDQKKPPVEETKDDKSAQNDKKEETQSKPEDLSEEDPDDGDQELVGKSKSGILALNPFTVNLNDPFGRRYAEVVINLEIVNKNYIPKLTANELILPRIRDEVFMIISNKSYNEVRTTSGKVTLKEEIMMRLNELMKEEFNKELISRIYFTKFIVQ